MLGGEFLKRQSEECVRRSTIKWSESVWSCVIVRSFSVDKCHYWRSLKLWRKSCLSSQPHNNNLPGYHEQCWRRKWQPTPVLLPRKFHGLRSLVGYSPWGQKELGMTERFHSWTNYANSTWVHLKNDRMISVCFQGKPFSITVIQVYAPSTDSKEAEADQFYKDLENLLELTPNFFIFFYSLFQIGMQK